MKEKYVEWNRQGFIPGPGETEEAFNERVRFCLEERDRLEEHVGKEAPFVSQNHAVENYYREPLVEAERLYGIAPAWVPLVFFNKGLLPWHGGCAWIYTLTPEAPVSAFLQLRKTFSESSILLGIYHRDEIITHELSHVGRMAFDEPLFEEVFAYRSSPSSFRRTWGPLIQAPWEGNVFLLTLFLPLFFTLLGLKAWAFWIYALPLGLFLGALGRLFRKHRLLDACEKKLAPILDAPEKAPHVAYRLSDQEIYTFAQSSFEEIQRMIEADKEREFRWRFLCDVYGLTTEPPA